MISYAVCFSPDFIFIPHSFSPTFSQLSYSSWICLLPISVPLALGQALINSPFHDCSCLLPLDFFPSNVSCALLLLWPGQTTVWPCHSHPEAPGGSPLPSACRTRPPQSTGCQLISCPSCGPVTPSSSRVNPGQAVFCLCALATAVVFMPGMPFTPLLSLYRHVLGVAFKSPLKRYLFQKGTSLRHHSLAGFTAAA